MSIPVTALSKNFSCAVSTSCRSPPAGPLPPPCYPEIVREACAPPRRPQQVFFVATKRCNSGGTELPGGLESHAACTYMDGVDGGTVGIDPSTPFGERRAVIAVPSDLREPGVESATICPPSSGPRSSKTRLKPLAAGHARRKVRSPGRRNDPFHPPLTANVCPKKPASRVGLPACPQKKPGPKGRTFPQPPAPSPTFAFLNDKRASRAVSVVWNVARRFLSG